MSRVAILVRNTIVKITESFFAVMLLHINSHWLKLQREF